MIGFFRDSIDRVLGRGRHSTSVPVMDGPMQPNQRLESAPVVANAPHLDNLVTLGGALLCSSGQQLLAIGSNGLQLQAAFDAPIACLTASPGGALAIGLDGWGVRIQGGPHDGRSIQTLDKTPLRCPTAALFLDEDTLVIASGSSQHCAGQWQRDLMSRGSSGGVWRVDLRNGTTRPLALDLAFPYGLARSSRGTLLVTEAWAHRILELDAHQGSPRPVLEDLPAYPARLTPASSGGWWLALFAPRNQLIELVLQERGYCERMMAEVDQRFWVAPRLTRHSSLREPMQTGALKQMGILKPWSPTFSYGLVARLGEDFLPIDSWHSRADGTVHGVTSICEHEGSLIVAARGKHCAVRLDTTTMETQNP